MQKYIIVFSRHILNWGAERSTCSLCKGLKDRGYNVLVVIPHKGPIIELLENDKIEYLEHEYFGWLYEGVKRPSFKHLAKLCLLQQLSLIKLKGKLRKKDILPILAYSNTITFSFGIKFASSYKIPHVQHIRENIDAFDSHFIFGYDKSMKLINTSSAIMCTCNSIRNRYLKSLDPDKFFTVYNGVPPITNVPAKNFFEKDLQLVQIARFMEDKRVIDSLMAIRLLAEKGIHNIHLDIYGKGDEETLYRQFISANKLEEYITVKGFVEYIDFQKYHIGLMTSTFEAFSRSVLDYMNNGLAVIASNSGGNIEQVAEGKSGLLFNVKDPDSLADVIEQLYFNRDFLQELALNSRKRYMENFTQDRYVSRSNEIIINALRNG